MKEKINDIAEALTLAVSLKTGTVSELKELVCQDVLDKLVEWKWIRLGKDDWRLTSTGLRQSAFYRKPTKDRILVSLTENPEAHTVTISVEDNGTGIKPTEKEKELGKLFRELGR